MSPVPVIPGLVKSISGSSPFQSADSTSIGTIGTACFILSTISKSAPTILALSLTGIPNKNASWTVN